jgi:hypothetical protein
MRLLVGLVDSGLAPGLERQAVRIAEDGGVGPAGPDRLGHGSEMARVILDLAPGAELLSAQIFDDRPAASPSRVAAALDWLAGAGARIVNLSLGLREDAPALRQACARAAALGIDLVASAPPRGAPVFPAAYPEVIAVCGDARCGPGEVSVLGGDPADFGAWNGRTRRGASCAAASATGLIAAWRAAGGEGPAAVHLREIARWHGREDRAAGLRG